MHLTQDDVVAWLRRQTDKVVIETVIEGMAGRSLRPFDGRAYDSRLVLAHASRDEELPTGWQIEFLGAPADSRTRVEDALVAQSGTHCGYEVLSWAKHFPCPLCGEEVFAT